MDKGGRVVGMIVFALGIVVLFAVLWAAYKMFSAPAAAFLPAGNTSGQSISAAGVGLKIVWIFVKIALLFVMTLGASLIASKGIHLYLGSHDKQ